MRILLASNVYPPNFVGGAELIAHQQARALKSAGHEVEVFAGETQSFGKRHDVLHDELDGIPVHRISLLPRDFEPVFVNFSHARIERHFESVVRRFRPDVFHGHNLIGLSAALPRIARQAGALAIVTFHDHWGFCFKNTILKWKDRICTDFAQCAECLPTIDDGEGRGIPMRMRRDCLALMLDDVDAYVSPSRYLASAYVEAGFAPERFHVVPNGIEVERYQRRRSGRSEGVRLSFVGALLPHKAPALLAEALARIPSDLPVTLNFVGSGPEKARCETTLSRAKRLDRVRFWGRVDHDQMPRVFAETDVLVLPSIWPENQPVSILEAMASGVAVIASDVGGVRELVEDGVTGKVFQAGDVSGLAECIACLAEEPDLAVAYGEAARRRVSPYSVEAHARELVSVYEKVKRRGRSRPPARLIVCVGSVLTSSCAEVMARFPSNEGWRFLSLDWVDEELARQAWLCWFAGSSSGPEELVAAEDLNAPLLLPIGSRDLVREAFAARRALYYADGEQAVSSIQALHSDLDLHARLSASSASGQENALAPGVSK